MRGEGGFQSGMPHVGAVDATWLFLLIGGVLWCMCLQQEPYDVGSRSHGVQVPNI